MSAKRFKPDYQFAADNCDVLDREELVEFRSKRDEWLHWLLHDENHAISNQISQMLWSDAVFRLVNASRREAAGSDAGFATQSGIIAQALDRGYVAEQLTAFRRLNEPASKSRKRQIISLRRLLDDMRAHRHLLTREHFVCYDGLPFDTDAVQQPTPNLDQSGVSFGWLETTGPSATNISRLQHETFDDLMDVVPSKRSRSDRIGEKFFEKLETELNNQLFTDLRDYANKLLLHAADSYSMSSVTLEDVTLEKFWTCHRAILKVATQLSIAIDAPQMPAIPHPQFDVLEHWSRPFAPEDAFDRLMEDWHAQNEEREQWTRS